MYSKHAQGWMLLLAMLPLAAATRPATAGDRIDAAALQKQVAARVAEFEKHYHGVVGMSVVDLTDGKTLVDLRADELRIPASNQKLLTTAAALAKLGAAFKFTTGVYQWGDDLLVFGDGDPTLGDPVIAKAGKRSIYADLDAWAAAVKETVGAKVAGDLIVCGLADTDSYRHPDWPRGQWSRWYAAPVTGLNFHNNCFDVTFPRTADGGIGLAVQPTSDRLRVVSELRPGRKQLWSLRLTDDDAVLTFRGTVAKATDDPISVAVNDPPMLLGRVLADRLGRAGVTLGGTVRALPPEKLDTESVTMVTCTRTPLADVMARANKRSLNMAAECLFKRSGDGTWDGSAKAMTETLAKDYGLDPNAFRVVDGSGLARDNRVTPHAMTTLLAGVLKRRDAAVFTDSLPISGVDGSLDDRMAGDYRGRVLGKTGYIGGVSCLSGYILDARGGRPVMAFSILGTFRGGGYRASKDMQDDVCRMLVDALPRPSAKEGR